MKPILPTARREYLKGRQDRLQDLNWISHCAHSHLGSPTHPWAHTSPPGLTHSHLGSYPSSLTHTQDYILTPGLTHSHPCSPTHTWAHPLTPGLICLHLGSFLQQGHWTVHKTWNTSQGSSVYNARTSNNSKSCLWGLSSHWFLSLPSPGGQWVGSRGPSTSQAEHAPHVLSDKQPSGTVWHQKQMGARALVIAHIFPLFNKPRQVMTFEVGVSSQPSSHVKGNKLPSSWSNEEGYQSKSSDGAGHDKCQARSHRSQVEMTAQTKEHGWYLLLRPHRHFQVCS